MECAAKGSATLIVRFPPGPLGITFRPRPAAVAAAGPEEDLPAATAAAAAAAAEASHTSPVVFIVEHVAASSAGRLVVADHGPGDATMGQPPDPVAPGDELLAVNGVSVAGMTTSDVSDLLQRRAAEHRDLSLRRSMAAEPEAAPRRLPSATPPMLTPILRTQRRPDSTRAAPSLGGAVSFASDGSVPAVGELGDGCVRQLLVSTLKRAIRPVQVKPEVCGLLHCALCCAACRT